MGKKLVIIAFLVSFAIALFVFFTRDTTSLRESIGGTTGREPRVILEDFVLYRYNNNSLISSLTARLAHVFEPNTVELFGEIVAVSYKGDSRETLGAESAIGYFASRSLGGMMKNADLKKAVLRDFVEIGMKNHLLATDYAEYIADEDVVKSKRPVRLEGPGRVFNGEEGFVYRFSDEYLRMPGKITGEIKPERR